MSRRSVAAAAALERIYAKAGIPNRFRGAFYDEPHSFSPRMQEDAFEWFPAVAVTARRGVMTRPCGYDVQDA